MLEQHRAALAAELLHAMRDTQAGAETVQPDDAADDLDAGAMMMQNGIRFSMMDMKSEMLRNVNEALARISEGRYGICESCESHISDARLRALPFALRCTRCEEEKEDARRRTPPAPAARHVSRGADERRAGRADDL